MYEIIKTVCPQCDLPVSNSLRYRYLGEPDKIGDTLADMFGFPAISVYADCTSAYNDISVLLNSRENDLVTVYFDSQILSPSTWSEAKSKLHNESLNSLFLSNTKVGAWVPDGRILVVEHQVALANYKKRRIIRDYGYVGYLMVFHRFGLLDLAKGDIVP